MKLSNCGKLEIRESPVEGFGIFANAPINKGEVLEEVPFILFPRHTNLSKSLYDFLNGGKWINDREKYIENLRLNLKFKDPEKYYFKWSPQIQLEGDPVTFTVLPLGNGPIYNSSNTDNNASWRVRDKTFVFIAEKDIKTDEEIKTFYGYLLGHDGTTFNADNVFAFGIDVMDGIPRLRTLRFPTAESNEAAKSNPSFARTQQLISSSRFGLKIRRIIGSSTPTEDKFSLEVSERIPLTDLYNKVQEARHSIFPFIKFVFEYENQENQVVSETVLFKK